VADSTCSLLQVTVSSVKQAFRALRFTASDRITLFALFEGFDGLIQVTHEMWSELLPQFTAITVVLDDAAHGRATLEEIFPVPHRRDFPLTGEGSKPAASTPKSPPPDIHSESATVHCCYSG
jgi:hypothetical protein